METDPTLERQFKGHKDAVTSISFHPSTKQFVSGSFDHSVMLWNFQSSLRCYRFQGHRDAVLDTRFSPSGSLIASASRDCAVRLWVPTVKGECGEFRAHSKTVRSVDFSPTGTQLITASDDKTLKLWTVHRRKFLQSYVQHKNWVRCARFSPDGSMIASCSDDKTVKIWDADNAKCIHTFEESKGYGTHIAWHPTGFYVAVGLSNGTVKLYDVRKNSLLQHYRAHDGGITQLAFHSSGNFLLVASQDKKMKILDLLEGHPIYTLMGHDGPITAVTFSSDGEYFASGGADKQIMIWKTNFAMGEYLNDSKENISTLEDTSSTVSKEEKMADITRVVDARKSAYFQPYDLSDETICYCNEEPLKIPIPIKSYSMETSRSEEQWKIRKDCYYSGLFKSYYNEMSTIDSAQILTQFLSNGKRDKVTSTSMPDKNANAALLTCEDSLFKKIKLNEILCEPEDVTILPTVKAMVCHLGSIQNILYVMEQRLTVLEDNIHISG